MKITDEGDRCLSVELSQDDMKRLDITYEELDYANVETRRVLWTVLDEARRVSGRDISLSDRLIIETQPSQEGGCLIRFTCVPGTRRRKGGRTVDETGCLVCDFATVDRLLDFTARMREPQLHCRSELYEQDGVYRVLFYPDLRGRDALIATVSEYTDCHADTDGLMSAYTAEYWRCISRDFAAAFPIDGGETE